MDPRKLQDEEPVDPQSAYHGQWGAPSPSHRAGRGCHSEGSVPKAGLTQRHPLCVLCMGASGQPPLEKASQVAVVHKKAGQIGPIRHNLGCPLTPSVTSRKLFYMLTRILTTATCENGSNLNAPQQGQGR